MTYKYMYFIANWKMFGDFSSFKIINSVNNYINKTKSKKNKIIFCVPSTLINNFYNKLKKSNIDVLLDDTDENISSKLKKFDLIGVPYQIILGKNSEQDLLEFKEIDKEAKQLSINEIIKILTTKKK